MPYDVYLEQDGESVKVERHEEGSTYTLGGYTLDGYALGGTYALGGFDRAELSITHNYAGNYKKVGFSIRDLDSKPARETITMLNCVVSELGTIRDTDYWAATDGNAGYAASILLDWARQYPDAIWDV